MAFNLRSPQIEKDLPRIVVLNNLDESEPVAEREFAEWLKPTPGHMLRLMVAADEHDAVIGYSEVTHESYYEPGRMFAWLVVDVEHHGQGIGSALYDEVVAFTREQGATYLTTDIRDNDEESLRFARKRGFVIYRHLFESVLDLAAFDETPYAACIDAVKAQGIRLLSLAEAGDTPEARRKLYDLNYTTVLDIPGSTGSWQSFEEFSRGVFASNWFNPEGQILAADVDAFIGLSAVRLYPESQGSYNLMTGVLAPYRGRKIALALKLLAIRYARSHGARYMRTHNNSQNAPILAINRKLGYCPEPGKYSLRCEL